MMINSILITIMAVADRILIASMLSREMLGIYGVANVGIYVIRTASTSIGQLFLVKFSEMHGQNRSVKNTAEALDKSVVALSAFLAPLVARVIAVFPVLVWLLLPRFTAGIGAGRLLIAEVYFLALSLPPANWCVATGRYVSVILVRGGLVATEVIGIWLLLRYDGGLEKVAGCVLSVSAICCLSMIIIVTRGLKRKAMEGFIQSGYALAPFAAIMIGIGIQCGAYERLRLEEGARLGLSCALGGLVSLAICLPFVVRASRILGLSKLMRDTFEG
jgi:O-antigen/teichoic acid export membrane protein